MATRKIMLTYGEQTETLSIRVPISKSVEIRERFERILKEYENPQRVDVEVRENLEKKSNPANDTLELVVNHKAPEWATKHKQVIKTETSKFEVKKIEPQVVEEVNDAAKSKENGWLDSKAVDHKDLQIIENPSQQVKKDKVKALQEMADLIKNGNDPKNASFTTAKKSIDEIYDCIIVEKGVPVESDRVYYGSNNRIAFWDRDDATVFYVNWEGKYYRFVTSSQFNKFCKDNNVK